MRWIQKQDDLPRTLANFLDEQLPLGLNLDYKRGFTRQRDLCLELAAEQFDLCGYTGAPLDERLGKLKPPPTAPGSPPSKLRYSVHIEHLKPQSVCRQELLDMDLEPGKDIGGDMNHKNMIAALLVTGSDPEIFGAAARKNLPVPVWPTHPDCETRFSFDENGGIEGLDPEAKATVTRLKLDHTTLEGWRKGAIAAFLAPEIIQTREDIEQLIQRLDQPQDGKLVEFSFVVKSVAQALLNP
jgi:hypothetical protein